MRHNLLRAHKLTREYLDSQYGRTEMVTLGFYLQGKPDNPEWREIFNRSEVIPVRLERKNIS